MHGKASELPKVQYSLASKSYRTRKGEYYSCMVYSILFCYRFGLNLLKVNYV